MESITVLTEKKLLTYEWWGKYKQHQHRIVYIMGNKCSIWHSPEMLVLTTLYALLDCEWGNSSTFYVAKIFWFQIGFTINNWLTMTLYCTYSTPWGCVFIWETCNLSPTSAGLKTSKSVSIFLFLCFDYLKHLYPTPGFAKILSCCLKILTHSLR